MRVKTMETAAKLWAAAQARADLAEELFSDKTSRGLCVWGWWWWASLPCSSSSSCHCCVCCCTSRQNTRQAAGPILKLQTVPNINPKLVCKKRLLGAQLHRHILKREFEAGHRKRICLHFLSNLGANAFFFNRGWNPPLKSKVSRALCAKVKWRWRTISSKCIPLRVV